MNAKSPSSISRNEWLWVLVAALGLFLLTSLPYWVGFHAQTSTEIFSGAATDRQDYAAHMAAMHLGQAGDWAFHFLFTSEQQSGMYVRLAYVFLGHVSSWTGLDSVAIYHLARLVFGVLACILIYELGAFVFSEPFWRRAFFFLAVMGAGLGWLQFIFGWVPQADISPVDFWLIDAYVFFGWIALPHFMAVTAMLVGMLVGGLSYLQRSAWWKWLGVVLCTLLIQAIQPYAPLLGDVALAAAFMVMAWQKHRFEMRNMIFLAALAIAQVPLLVQALTVFRDNPILAEFAAQNVTLSPPPIYYVWGFGLFWPAAILGSWYLIRRLAIKRETSYKISVEPANRISEEPVSLAAQGAATAWVIVALVMAYAPTLLQRRFMMAFTIPLGLLAVAGLRKGLEPKMSQTVPSWLNRWGHPLVVMGIAIAGLSSLYLSFGNAIYLSQRPAAAYDPASLVEAVDWLGEHAGPSDVVLSSEATGQLAAARAGLTVYIGHPIETLDYVMKSQLVKEFFSGQMPPGWLDDTNIKWVIFGPYEREIGSWEDAAIIGKLVFQKEGVTVYQVVP